jgi:hypothetical protein
LNAEELKIVQRNEDRAQRRRERGRRKKIDDTTSTGAPDVQAPELGGAPVPLQRVRVPGDDHEGTSELPVKQKQDTDAFDSNEGDNQFKAPGLDKSHRGQMAEIQGLLAKLSPKERKEAIKIMDKIDQQFKAGLKAEGIDDKPSLKQKKKAVATHALDKRKDDISRIKEALEENEDSEDSEERMWREAEDEQEFVTKKITIAGEEMEVQEVDPKQVERRVKEKKRAAGKHVSSDDDDASGSELDVASAALPSSTTKRSVGRVARRHESLRRQLEEYQNSSSDDETNATDNIAPGLTASSLRKPATTTTDGKTTPVVTNDSKSDSNKPSLARPSTAPATTTKPSPFKTTSHSSGSSQPKPKYRSGRRDNDAKQQKELDSLLTSIRGRGDGENSLMADFEDLDYSAERSSRKGRGGVSRRPALTRNNRGSDAGAHPKREPTDRFESRSRSTTPTPSGYGGSNNRGASRPRFGREKR